MTNRFPAAVTRVLDQPEVRTEIVDEPVFAFLLRQCEWCQMDGATCSFTATWTPREDVLSDGFAECCQSCAPECIRRAIDDAKTDSTVTVEIAGGGA